MNFVVEHDQVVRLMDMKVEEMRPGFARVSMPFADKIKNGMGFAHGGAIFALADVAFGVAANEGSETCVVSLSTAIDFLASCSCGPLVAEANVIRSGGHIANFEVRVLDGKGQMIARASATGYRTKFPQNK